ncbi:MAG: hypothetical protein JNK87_09840 [Bryobacterales bacterium]|nr:hypothetical protein [Bryobacterales bacterium]
MILLAAALLTTLAAQAQVPSFTFGYKLSTEASLSALGTSNGTILLPATAQGASVTTQIHITNTSPNTTWFFAGAAATGDAYTLAPPAGTSLAPNATYILPIRFAPLAPGLFTSTLTIRLRTASNITADYNFLLVGNGTAAPPTTTPANPTNPATPTTTAADVAVSYMFIGRGNNIPISTGDTIPFPTTAAGTRVSASIVLTNRGSAGTTVTAAALTGTGFEMNSLPLLPATVIAGGELRFNVVFVPIDGQNTYRGELRLTIAGQTRTFTLSGSGQFSQITYERLINGESSPVQPGATITFPSLPAGGGSNIVTVRFRNEGNGEARLNGVVVSGNVFYLLDQPPPPILLKPGEAISVRIQFTPTDVADYTGQLRIDNALFPLAGRGTGIRLGTTLLIGEERFPLRVNTRGVIPNTEVGSRRQFFIEVANSGDETAVISAVQFTGEGFALTQAPPLPLRIAPAGSILLAGTFTPQQVGSIFGFLTIQDLSYQIIGVATEPPPLPDIRYTGLPATPQPLQQPAVGLELAQSYPYDITGALRLSFTTDTYIDDPAVQFLNGLRNIDFRIPAGSRTAIFGLNSQSIRMQTGSLAGAITLVAQLSTGKIDLSRSTPPVAVLNIPPAAPVLRLVEINPRNARSFELILTGAATTRTLSRFQFVLTPNPGAKLQRTTIPLDVARQFENWFSSANSRPYGGQFRASVVFDLTADYGAIKSIEITATNSLGTSAPRTLVITPEK